MNIEQHGLHALIRVVADFYVAIQQVVWHIVASGCKVAKRRIPKGRSSHGCLNARASWRTVNEVLGHSHSTVLRSIGTGGIAAAKNGLKLAKLRRLKTARRLQEPSKRVELQGSHGLKNVDLRHAGFHDGAHAAKQRQRAVSVASLQRCLQRTRLVQQLLEPQLVRLVNDDEQHLVVLGAIRLRLLQLEQFVDL